MDIDTDVHRDAASAFGPASLTAGSMLPFEGRTLLRSPDGVPGAAMEAREDGWVSPDVPVLVRGKVRILPLARTGTELSADALDALLAQMQAAGLYWAGNWRVLPLTDRRSDGIGSYTAALRAAGATSVDCWTLSETEGLALVTAEDAGERSLAWHVVPAGWVSEVRVGKSEKGIDVRWSWADVVALRAAGFLGAASGADSVAGAHEEGHSRP